MKKSQQWWKWTQTQWNNEVQMFIKNLKENSKYILEHYEQCDDTQMADFMGRIFMSSSGEVLSNMQNICEIASMVSTDEHIKALTKELSNVIRAAAVEIMLTPGWVAVLGHLEKNSQDKNVIRICHEVQQLFTIRGLYLSKPDAKKFTKISNDIKKLAKEFDFENDTYEKFIVCSGEDLVGLSSAYISGLEKTDKGYKITTAPHHAGQFITYAPNLVKARELAVLCSQKGGVKNLKRLHAIALLRQQLADLVGFENFAQMNISTRSQKNLSALFTLAQKLSKAHDGFYKTDMTLLREVGGYKKTQKIPSWMVSRISKKISDEKLKLPDGQTLKNYFEYERVLPLIVEDLCKLLSLTFEKNSTKYWHTDVVSYSFFDSKTKQKFGDIFFDMIGRKNKNAHPCCAAYGEGAINMYMPDIMNKESRAAVILMPLAQKTKTSPTLMSFYDVQVLFHELGHAFHNILGSHQIACLAGYNVPWDIVEIPSQLFEHFLLNVSTIKKYSQHFETKESLAAPVIKKILACQHLFSGYGNKYQLHNYTYDLLIHSSEYNNDPKELYKSNFSSIIKDIEPLPESTSPSNFGHIVHGYEAGYYTYMWTLLIAYDVAGHLQSGSGWSLKKLKEFRIRFLEAGNSLNIIETLEHLLGRKINTGAMVALLETSYQEMESIIKK